MSEEEGFGAWESVLGVESPRDQSSLDLIYSLLSNSRRRFVIEYLHQHEESTTLSELAAQLAAQESDTDTESIADKQRKIVYVSLYQVHLPRLNDAGFIEYDADTGAVTHRDTELIEHAVTITEELPLDDTDEVDNLFTVLRNSRRRFVLRYLKENGGSAEFDELARHLAGREEGIEPDEVSERQKRRVFISLYQTHLAQLENHGLVDWDRDSMEVRLLGES